MCDTQVRIADNGIWFAKNSDREPDEPQLVERHAAVRGDRSPRVRATHVEIDQVPDRHGLILSRPSWIWGAEIGANDQGLVIGNEAIFSRLRGREPALLGMDLLRLALERAAGPQQAIDVITGLLEQHGQGGPAGYRDKAFCYDNSYLLANADEAWVLETAGRHWAARQVRDYWAISNTLSIGTDHDRLSAECAQAARRHVDGRVDFRASFDTVVMPRLAAAGRRAALGRSCLARQERPDFEAMATNLRRHAGGNEDPMRGSNADICMHAAGIVRRSQTTGSLIAWLRPGDTRLVATGTSAPCLSLFRPLSFEPVRHAVLTPLAAPVERSLWARHEPLHRRALFDAGFRACLRTQFAAAEGEVFATLAEERVPDPRALEQLDDRCCEVFRNLIAEAGEIPQRARGVWRRIEGRDGLGGIRPERN